MAQSEPIRAALTKYSEPTFVLSTGVQLFFVLSGFLLCLPYVRAMQFGLPFPSTWAFYKRRALRILPAYWATLAVMALLESVKWRGFLFHVLLLHNVKNKHFYSINVAFWTLAIEWQFYLLLPGIAYLFWRFAKARRHGAMAAALAGIIVLGHLTGCLGGMFPRSPEGFYSSLVYLPASLAVFACGAAAAWVYVRLKEGEASRSANSSHVLATVLGLAGLALIVALIGLAAAGARPFFHHADDYWKYGNLLLGVGYSLIVLGAVCGGKLWHILLANRPLRFVGMISFSLYLWHIPLIERISPSIVLHSTTWWVMPIGWALTLAISIPFAAGFYQLIEKPFLARKNRGVPIKPPAAQEPSPRGNGFGESAETTPWRRAA